MGKRYESDMTAKEKFQAEIEKLKGMTWREKIVHIWAYYKPLLIAVLVIIIAADITIDAVQEARMEDLLCIGIADANSVDYTNMTQQTDEYEALEKELLELLGSGSKYERVTIDTGIMTWAGETTGYEKISTMIGAEKLDILICREAVHQTYKAQDLFADLETVLGEDYSRYEAYMTDGAIDLSLSEKWMEGSWVRYSPVYMDVIADCGNYEQVKVFLEYFFPEV